MRTNLRHSPFPPWGGFARKPWENPFTGFWPSQYQEFAGVSGDRGYLIYCAARRLSGLCRVFVGISRVFLLHTIPAGRVTSGGNPGTTAILRRTLNVHETGQIYKRAEEIKGKPWLNRFNEMFPISGKPRGNPSETLSSRTTVFFFFCTIQQQLGLPPRVPSSYMLIYRGNKRESLGFL